MSYCLLLQIVVFFISVSRLLVYLDSQPKFSYVLYMALWPHKEGIGPVCVDSLIVAVLWLKYIYIKYYPIN